MGDLGIMNPVKIRFVYEFHFAGQVCAVWEVEQPLLLAVGDKIQMKELWGGGQLTIQKEEHHLEKLEGVAVCKTCIHCH